MNKLEAIRDQIEPPRLRSILGSIQKTTPRSTELTELTELDVQYLIGMVDDQDIAYKLAKLLVDLRERAI